jgi:hypothetical protein
MELGHPGRSDGCQWRREHGDADRGHGRHRADRGRPHHAGRPQLAARHPQGAECGVLGGFDERLARQELTHHPDGDEREQATEEPQRDGLEMDGALDVRRLLRSDQVELGLTAHEAMDIVDERGDVGTTAPEPHHRLLEAQHLRPDRREGGRAHVREVGREARRELRRELTW